MLKNIVYAGVGDFIVYGIVRIKLGLNFIVKTAISTVVKSGIGLVSSGYLYFNEPKGISTEDL